MLAICESLFLHAGPAYQYICLVMLQGVKFWCTIIVITLPTIQTSQYYKITSGSMGPNTPLYDYWFFFIAFQNFTTLRENTSRSPI